MTTTTDDSPNDAPETAIARRPDGRCPKGVSGNPRGPRPGTLSKKTRAMNEAFLAHAAKAARRVGRLLNDPDPFVVLGASRIVIQGATAAAAALAGSEERPDARYATLEEQQLITEIMGRIQERQRLGILPSRHVVDVTPTAEAKPLEFRTTSEEDK